MIWRIRERSGFRRLHADGQRLRSGALWCTYLPDLLCEPPQVAFAFGRALGPAVTRNRLRRRLRHALAQRPLPAGLYLFGARPAAAQQSFSELMCDLDRMLAKLPRAGSSQVTGAAMPVMHTNTVTAPDTETVTVTDGLSARPVGG